MSNVVQWLGSNIQEDAQHRLVTDTQINRWDSSFYGESEYVHLADVSGLSGQTIYTKCVDYLSTNNRDMIFNLTNKTYYVNINADELRNYSSTDTSFLMYARTKYEEYYQAYLSHEIDETEFDKLSNIFLYSHQLMVYNIKVEKINTYFDLDKTTILGEKYVIYERASTLVGDYIYERTTLAYIHYSNGEISNNDCMECYFPWRNIIRVSPNIENEFYIYNSIYHQFLTMDPLEAKLPQ